MQRISFARTLGGLEVHTLLLFSLGSCSISQRLRNPEPALPAIDRACDHSVPSQLGTGESETSRGLRNRSKHSWERYRRPRSLSTRACITNWTKRNPWYIHDYGSASHLGCPPRRHSWRLSPLRGCPCTPSSRGAGGCNETSSGTDERCVLFHQSALSLGDPWVSFPWLRQALLVLWGKHLPRVRYAPAYGSLWSEGAASGWSPSSLERLWIVLPPPLPDRSSPPRKPRCLGPWAGQNTGGWAWDRSGQS